MWLDSFRALSEAEQLLASILLKDRISLSTNGIRLRTSTLERASGVLATRLATQLAPGGRRRLVFLLPNSTQSLGRFLAVSLLVADFVHRDGRRVPFHERGPLLRGDLLLVTQHIRECVALLRAVSVQHGSEALPLSSFWPIEVLSQYTPSLDDRPRVFVANPGWYSTLGERAIFASVVIDASHPRTADHLHGLLAQSTIAAAPVQILVIPPWEEDRLRRLQESHRLTTLAWAWDPAAVTAIERVLSVSTAVTELLEPERHIWVCPDEPVHTLLAPLHEALLGAMRVGGRQLPSAIFEAWAVYHRLRELAVPLVQVEETWRRAYRPLTLKERLHMLEEHIPKSSGTLGVYLESRWPKIVDNLRATYDTLLQRMEPAKFYTLASVVEQHLQSREDSGQLSSLRIVAPTLHEADLLSSLLGQVIDGWSDALLEGAVILTTVREEPRLIAEGHRQASVLLGFRTSETRYLDVYPGVPVHVVAYPYEAEVDEAIQRRVHASIEQLQQDTTRTTLLSALHFPVTQPTRVSGIGESGQLEELVPRTRRPYIRYHVELGRPLSITHRFQADTVEPLDMGKLAGMTWTDELVIGNLSETTAADVDRAERFVEFVEVVDADGDHVRYPASRLIDVYYPAPNAGKACQLASCSKGCSWWSSSMIAMRISTIVCSRPSKNNAICDRHSRWNSGDEPSKPCWLDTGEVGDSCTSISPTRVSP
jgi:hypothetical protein